MNLDFATTIDTTTPPAGSHAINTITCSSNQKLSLETKRIAKRRIDHHATVTLSKSNSHSADDINSGFSSRQAATAGILLIVSICYNETSKLIVVYIKIM